MTVLRAIAAAGQPVSAATSNSHYLTLLATLVGIAAVIGGAIWRVGGAVFNLAYEVRKASWRLTRIESELGIEPLPPHDPRLRPPRPPRRRGRRPPPEGTT